MVKYNNSYGDILQRLCQDEINYGGQHMTSNEIIGPTEPLGAIELDEERLQNLKYLKLVP